MLVGIRVATVIGASPRSTTAGTIAVRAEAILGAPSTAWIGKMSPSPRATEGDITKWMQWSSTFVRYLGRQDEKWPLILKRIEGHKGKMISEADENQINEEFYLWGIKLWKEALMLALESFTSGETMRIILLAEERGVFSSWSRLADKGHSLKDDHVKNMRRKVMAPTTSVPAKDLEFATLAWEKEVLQFEEAANETLDEKNRF